MALRGREEAAEGRVWTGDRGDGALAGKAGLSGGAPRAAGQGLDGRAAGSGHQGHHLEHRRRRLHSHAALPGLRRDPRQSQGLRGLLGRDGDAPGLLQGRRGVVLRAVAARRLRGELRHVPIPRRQLQSRCLRCKTRRPRRAEPRRLDQRVPRLVRPGERHQGPARPVADVVSGLELAPRRLRRRVGAALRRVHGGPRVRQGHRPLARQLARQDPLLRNLRGPPHAPGRQVVAPQLRRPGHLHPSRRRALRPPRPRPTPRRPGHLRGLRRGLPPGHRPRRETHRPPHRHRHGHRPHRALHDAPHRRHRPARLPSQNLLHHRRRRLVEKKSREE
mmetsp:Transcript_26049/g.80178  ORF Transcript_26049/g.80178 Transcript_26049/m.80178 type:complete len:333 (+) Transcript_26049:117-1115(+)